MDHTHPWVGVVQVALPVRIICVWRKISWELGSAGIIQEWAGMVPAGMGGHAGDRHANRLLQGERLFLSLASLMQHESTNQSLPGCGSPSNGWMFLVFFCVS